MVGLVVDSKHLAFYVEALDGYKSMEFSPKKKPIYPELSDKADFLIISEKNYASQKEYFRKITYLDGVIDANEFKNDFKRILDRVNEVNIEKKFYTSIKAIFENKVVKDKLITVTDPRYSDRHFVIIQDEDFSVFGHNIEQFPNTTISKDANGNVYHNLSDTVKLWTVPSPYNIGKYYAGNAPKELYIFAPASYKLPDFKFANSKAKIIPYPNSLTIDDVGSILFQYTK